MIGGVAVVYVAGVCAVVVYGVGVYANGDGVVVDCVGGVIGGVGGVVMCSSSLSVWLVLVLLL